MLNKYEESQGLTEEMVAPSLAAIGGPEEKYCLELFRTDRDELIEIMAKASGMTPQAMLRVINPRWRPWPSKEARAAHQGHWLAFDPRDENVVMGRFDGPWFKHIENFVIEKGDPILYWPCVLGNKIPWPEKDGVML